MNTFLLATTAVAVTLAAQSAKAVDGCTVLLCLAGNWRNISQCVPPVQQAFRDMAFGKPFPSCTFVNADGSRSDSAESGDYAVNSTPTVDTCPPMYSIYNSDSGEWAGCTYYGLVSLVINGQPWDDVFWDMQGNTSTRYYDQARAQLPPEQLDPRYDDDLAAWNAAHPVDPGDPGGPGNER